MCKNILILCSQITTQVKYRASIARVLVPYSLLSIALTQIRMQYSSVEMPHTNKPLNRFKYDFDKDVDNDSAIEILSTHRSNPFEQLQSLLFLKGLCLPSSNNERPSSKQSVISDKASLQASIAPSRPSLPIANLKRAFQNGFCDPAFSSTSDVCNEDVSLMSVSYDSDDGANKSETLPLELAVESNEALLDEFTDFEYTRSYLIPRSLEVLAYVAIVVYLTLYFIQKYASPFTFQIQMKNAAIN
jgi:hypothetical protein